MGWEGNGFFRSTTDARRYFNFKSLTLEKEMVLGELQQQLQYEITYDNNNNVIIKCEMNSPRPDEAIMHEKYLVFKDLSEKKNN